MSENECFYDQWRLICPEGSFGACDPILLQAWGDGLRHRQKLVAAEVEHLLKNPPKPLPGKKPGV